MIQHTIASWGGQLYSVTVESRFLGWPSLLSTTPPTLKKHAEAKLGTLLGGSKKTARADMLVFILFVFLFHYLTNSGGFFV